MNTISFLRNWSRTFLHLSHFDMPKDASDGSGDCATLMKPPINWDQHPVAKIMIITWNVGNCSPASFDESILFDKQHFDKSAAGVSPDIVVIGFQEVDASLHNNLLRHWNYSDWSVKLMQHMAAHGFIMIHHDSFPGLLSIMFVRYDWVPFVNLVEADTTKLMFESLVGSKGAIGIRAKIGNETVCFINSHLPAHLADHKERDKAYLTILADQFYSGCQSTVLNHDFVFWFGDLNFRIDNIPNPEVKRRIQEAAASQHHPAAHFHTLLENDQLKFSIASGRSFASFEEAPILFAPTYKFNVGSHEYDTSEKKRKPAWCDRILWRDKPTYKLQQRRSSTMTSQDGTLTSSVERGVFCSQYFSIDKCCASDHKPVVGRYEIRLDNFHFQALVSIELPAHDCKEGEIKAKKGEKIKFKLKPSKEFTNKIDGWDWIGVYSEQEAVKLKDYCSSKYVTSSDWSKSRLKMEPKEFKLSNPSSSASSGAASGGQVGENAGNGKYAAGASSSGSNCGTSGRMFRIIYHSAKLKSAIGTSPPFTISE